MSLEIVPVEGRRLLSEFIDVPWRIPDIAGHPKWVPPLRMMIRDNLDTKRNPFYRAAARGLFLARRDGRAVGRIAAIENHAHNQFHDDRVGFFGFFESVNDAEVAGRLLDAAAEWLRVRGLTEMRGPVNPSTNHDCGILVEGFDEHPMFLTTWNPAYYDALVKRAGLDPVKDLLGYWVAYGDPGYDTSRADAIAKRAKNKAKIEFRDLQPDRFWSEVELCWDIYNAAWERNWGFVPMTHDEFLFMAKSLRPLLLPQFAFLAEIEKQPAGVMLSVPDFNLILKTIRDGRLFPFGFLKILRGKSRLRTGRIMALGIKQEFRKGSILPLFMHEGTRRAIAFGSPGCEASWVLEDNQAMRQVVEGAGGRPYRRWRLYERSLAR
jgi:hypothetical protein